MHIRLLVGLTAYLCLVSAAGAQEKSVFWMPYANDSFTAALFHLDDVSPDSLLQGDYGAPDLAPPPGGDADSTPSAVNAATMGESGELEGQCEFVREGRFGGSLRLHGGKAALVIGSKYSRGWALEGWFCAAALPKERATLLHLPRGNPVRVDLLADGRLAVNWMQGATAQTAWRYAPKSWFHLALGWHPTDDGGEMVLSVNGKPVLTSSAGADSIVHAALNSEQLTIGNDSDGQAGLDGWVDEVRLSSIYRGFYEPDLDWVDREGKRPSPAGQPYFRDSADLLFQLNFNNSLAPVRATPATKFVPVTPEQLREQPKKYAFAFTEGVEKQGLLLQPDGKAADYDGAGIISSARGTVAFWSRPLDWDNAKLWNKFAPWPQEFVPVFTVSQQNAPVLKFTWVKTPDQDTTSYPVDFNPGQWMHVAIVWDGGTTIAYVNGKPWRYAGSWLWERKAWDDGKPVHLAFNPSKDALAVDDFRIYRRALSPSEVANLTALFDRRTPLRPLPPFDFPYEANGVTGKIDLTFYPLVPDYAKVSAASVAVTRQGAAAPLGQARMPISPLQLTRMTVNMAPNQPFGTYKLTVTAEDTHRKPIKSVTAQFTRIKPAWWESTAGISDHVMPDWTPVQVTGDSVAVTGREFHFNGSGLPAKIISAGEDVLAAPIELQAGNKGNTLPLTPMKSSPVLRTVNELRVEGVGGVQGPGFTVNIASTTEYDGMMWFTATLIPEKGKSPNLDSLILRIPYREQNAVLMHWWSGEPNFRSPKSVWIGEVPSTPGTVFSSNNREKVNACPGLRGSFIPYMMLTGDRRGMAWFAENDRGWTQSTVTPAVTVTRAGAAVVLTCNIVSSPIALTGPRTFAFGLHPIPVKPLETGWRNFAGWTVMPDSFSVTDLKAKQPGSQTSFQRHPEAMDWDAVARRFDGKDGYKGYGWLPKGRQLRSVMVPGLYLDLRWLSSVPDDTREWFPDWYGYGWGGQGDTLRYTREQIDYSSWIFNEWVRRGFCYGLYMDDCWNTPQSVYPGPCAYKLPDGLVQPGFQWRGQREYIQRLRQIFYANNLPPHMCSHTTHTCFIPYHSSFDVLLDGEDFYTMNTDSAQDFMDFWSPARLRFNNAEKWGIATMWLGWHTGGFQSSKFPAWQYRHNRAYTGALLVHDLVWMNLDGTEGTLDKQWIEQAQLRTDPKVQFVPYWNQQGLAQYQHPNLYVSAWKRNGLCVVALANWSRTRIEAQVKLDPQAMGFGAAAPEALTVRDVDHANLMAHIKDITLPDSPTDDPLENHTDTVLDARTVTVSAEGDDAVTWQNGILSCPVRGHDFRLFAFSTGE